MIEKEELKFNEEDVRKFYRILKHKNPTEIIVFDKEKYPNGNIEWVNNEDDFVKVVKYFNVEKNVSVYAGVRDRTAAGNENVVNSHLIFIEADIREDLTPNIEKIDNWIKENDFKILLKGFSGGGYHWYVEHVHKDFKSEEDRKNYAKILRILKVACKEAALDIDPKIFDLQRVMRVLGTYNYGKNKLSKILYYDNN